MICLMARKNYSEDFRRQAVQLYESTPGATFKGIAADLGVSRGALAGWVRALGSDPDGQATSPAAEDSGGEHPGTLSASTPSAGSRPGRAPSSSRIARLEAQVAALEAEKKKLATERDILRQAAKYFAGETNW
jgi:transposase